MWGCQSKRRYLPRALISLISANLSKSAEGQVLDPPVPGVPEEGDSSWRKTPTCHCSGRLLPLSPSGGGVSAWLWATTWREHRKHRLQVRHKRTGGPASYLGWEVICLRFLETRARLQRSLGARWARTQVHTSGGSSIRGLVQAAGLSVDKSAISHQLSEPEDSQPCLSTGPQDTPRDLLIWATFYKLNQEGVSQSRVQLALTI